MVYQVRSIRQKENGNPVPASSYVYVRRVDPELPTIYRIQVPSDGTASQLSELSADRATWNDIAGAVSVADNRRYACCWIPQSEASNLRTYFVLSALSSDERNPNSVTPTLDDAAAGRLRAARYARPADVDNPTALRTNRLARANLLLTQ